ncbi:interference hedgehog-like isoform X2 [Chrysoperla carnea]|uniref:interference hedgehog-like isoform X2 n=1 Tax=Chrysoperla carnea TaxID=189513 RepID=UPI001D080B03|nr:interference hedgehog-like isoform X2 [Chrysoperla carnea]XP_044737049.1 interference hedgehog-like isoform X2 [Chrysoperla carnea]
MGTDESMHHYQSTTSNWMRFLIIEILILCNYFVIADVSLQVVSNPEPIAVPMEDRVTFDCTMSLKPDRFEWLHLPKWPHTLSVAYVIDHKRYENRGNSTSLRFKVDNKSKMGGYQCVAWYGAQAIASTPAMLTIAELGKFPKIPNQTINVTAGNTITLYCPPPPSNPPASIQYFRSDGYELKDIQTPSGALVIQNVTSKNSGEYFCQAENWITGITTDAPYKIYLNVGPHKLKEAPKFLRMPPKNYTVLLGENVTLECSAIGTPPPTIRWRRSDGVPIPRNRIEVTPVGLKLAHITRQDQATYACEVDNGVMPSLTHHATLMVHEMPVIISGPNSENSTEGDSLELECTVKGIPEPTIQWVNNGRSVLNDSNIEAIGNKIYINPVEKRHAGTIQCFASNIAGNAFSISLLTVYPKPKTGGDAYLESDTRSQTPGPPANSRKNHSNGKIHRGKNKNRRKEKNMKMIPPSKPNITRLSDTSVMVRWNVPQNDGLGIRLFKIQYREVSSNDPERMAQLQEKSSKWDTVNADIGPNVNTYEVDNLYTDSIYKFRIAAVYTNDDNKLGPNSAKFHLQRSSFTGRNPLPTPVLTRTEAINETAIRIYWDLHNEGNVSIEGFYINYRDLTIANDYIKETVDNASARSCIISHLVPGKIYEFKLQSFNAGAGSDFSVILTQQTVIPVTETSLTRDETTTGATIGSKSSKLQLYVIIGAAVGGIALLTGAILALVVCKRYRQKKAQNITGQGDIEDKRNSNDGSHHIQAESKDYSKSRRAMHNGCPPPGPKLTITPNPLANATADEDKVRRVLL